MAGGQAAGKLEIVKTSVSVAWDHANTMMHYGVDKNLPNFRASYSKAKQTANLGSTMRKDMPVINEDDVKKFQDRLSKGALDVRLPFAAGTTKNPFVQGLSGAKAQQFLSKGLYINDGSKNDDKVKARIEKVAVGKLKPIQKQIYFAKAFEGIADFGIDASTKFMKSTFFIASADNFIIDGHHRWLAAFIMDPNMSVQVLKIQLEIKHLLPLSLAYGDAIGNQRNL